MNATIKLKEISPSHALFVKYIFPASVIPQKKTMFILYFMLEKHDLAISHNIFTYNKVEQRT